MRGRKPVTKPTQSKSCHDLTTPIQQHNCQQGDELNSHRQRLF